MSQSSLYVVVNGNNFDRTSLVKSLTDVYGNQGKEFIHHKQTFSISSLHSLITLPPTHMLLFLSFSIAASGTDSADELLQLLHKTKQNAIVLLDVEAPLAKKGLFGISLVKTIVRDLNLGHVSVVCELLLVSLFSFFSFFFFFFLL